MPVRTPGSLSRTKTLEVPKSVYKSPDEQTSFVVKYADNRAVLARQNLFDQVRYVTRDTDGETETIRNFPMGDLRIETVTLVLTGWNVTDEDKKELPISRKTVLDCLDPSEMEWLYNQIIDMNPVWNNSAQAGED